MNNGEFYVSREDNYIGENKSFPAEIYVKPFEENDLGNETSDYGKESTTLQTKSRRKRDGNAKSLVERVFNSIKGVATTATIVASTIVVTTTVASGVNVDYVDLDVGSDYLEYETKITDVAEDCFVVIAAPNEDDVEIEIEESGTHKGRIDGLKPDCVYTFSVVTRDKVFGNATHYKEDFRTKPKEPASPDVVYPPDTYEGKYKLPKIDVSLVDWSKKQLTLPIVFEKIEEKYYYTLTVTDAQGNLLQTVKGSESANAVIDISHTDALYKISFQIYGVGTNEERLIVSHDLAELELVCPTVTVTDIGLAGENKVKVDFTSANAERVVLHTEYPDGSSDDIELTMAEIERGYTHIAVPETATTVSVTPIIVFDNYTLSGATVTREFKDNLEVDASVDLSDSYMSIDFSIRSITRGATYLHVESPDSEAYNGDYEIWEGVASLYYEERAEQRFILYLTDDTGARLSNEVELTLDTTQPQQMPEYVMNYKNPNQIGVTYNEDGTINIYIDTDFECEDETYYWQVRLGKYMLRSRDKLIVFEHLPNDCYPIEYSVCFDKDGVQYSIMSITPSGTVNELYFNEHCVLLGNLFTMTVGEDTDIDISTITLISSDGQERKIAETDFIADENGERTATVEFDNVPEYVTIRLMIRPNSYAEEYVGKYGGSMYTHYENDLYP